MTATALRAALVNSAADIPEPVVSRQGIDRNRGGPGVRARVELIPLVEVVRLLRRDHFSFAVVHLHHRVGAALVDPVRTVRAPGPDALVVVAAGFTPGVRVISARHCVRSESPRRMILESWPKGVHIKSTTMRASTC